MGSAFAEHRLRPFPRGCRHVHNVFRLATRLRSVPGIPSTTTSGWCVNFGSRAPKRLCTVPRMAKQLAVRLRLRGAHHIQLVEFHLLGAIHRRFGGDRVVDLEGIFGWWVQGVNARMEPGANMWTAATLDRYEVPFFGSLASSILDDE